MSIETNNKPANSVHHIEFIFEDDEEEELNLLKNTNTDDIDTHLYIGYVAEEVDAVDTNFSYKIPDSNGNLIPESIEWFNMLIYAIEEIKKLNLKVISLQSQIDNLQS